MKLVLASASPRRRELLTMLGVEFEAVASGVVELTAGDPAVIVVENAVRKARAVERPDAIVLGVDTDVVCDGRLLGKPDSDGDAVARLRALSGRTHEVLGGIALRRGERELSELVRTAVTFRALSDREIGDYVASGEWRDRAGGYAIQGLGSALVERVEGDLSNVIGLPIPALSRMIAELQGR